MQYVFMNITEIINKTKWNNYFGSLQRSQFLQSWEWGEFQKSLGHKVWRLGMEENEKLINAAQIIKYNLPFGKSYLYAPRVTGHSSLVTKELEKIVKKENAIFIKIEPAKQLSQPKAGQPLAEIIPAKGWSASGGNYQLSQPATGQPLAGIINYW